MVGRSDYDDLRTACKDMQTLPLFSPGAGRLHNAGYGHQCMSIVAQIRKELEVTLHQTLQAACYNCMYLHRNPATRPIVRNVRPKSHFRTSFGRSCVAM